MAQFLHPLSQTNDLKALLNSAHCALQEALRLICFCSYHTTSLVLPALLLRFLEQSSSCHLPALSLAALQSHFHSTPREVLLNGLPVGLLELASFPHPLAFFHLSIQDPTVSCLSKLHSNVPSLSLPEGLWLCYSLVYNTAPILCGVPSPWFVGSASKSYHLVRNLDRQCVNALAGPPLCSHNTLCLFLLFDFIYQIPCLLSQQKTGCLVDRRPWGSSSDHINS